MDRFPRFEEEGFAIPLAPSPVTSAGAEQREDDADRAWSGRQCGPPPHVRPPGAAAAEAQWWQSKAREAAWVARRAAVLTARALDRHDAQHPGQGALWRAVEARQARLAAGLEWCLLRAEARDPDGNPFADCIDPLDMP